MIGTWLGTLHDEQLQRIADATGGLWLFGDFGCGVSGCLLTHAHGDAYEAQYGPSTDVQAMGRYDDLNNRAFRDDINVDDHGTAHPRIVAAIRSRARRVLAERRLARIDDVTAVPFDRAQADGAGSPPARLTVASQ